MAFRFAYAAVPMGKRGQFALAPATADIIASCAAPRPNQDTCLEGISSSANSRRGREIGPGGLLRPSRRAMRQNLTTGDIPFRKEWLRSIIERIEVDDGVIWIIGDKTTLEQAVDGKPKASGGVRRSVPRWRAGRNETANSYVIEIVRQASSPERWVACFKRRPVSPVL